MKAILLAFSCFLALPLIAQDDSNRAPRSRIIMPAQSGSGVPGMPQQIVRRDPAPEPQQPEDLTHNITLRLQGTTANGNDIDLSLWHWS